MKLLQLNTWSGHLAPAIINLLQHERPDFVTFQEVISTPYDGKILGSIETVFESYKFKDVHYTPLVEFSFMHQRASRGNLIASQVNFIDKDQLWTHGSFIQDFDYLDSGGYNVARNIAHGVFIINGKPLHLLTLHGYHIKEHKRGNEETLRMCQILTDYASALKGAVIITGDFNLSPDSESIAVVNSSFRNLSIEYNLTSTRNYLTAKTEVCDYIFVNDLVEVLSFEMSGAVVSDHNALILNFNLS